MIVDLVRSTCTRVVENSKHVKINQEKLKVLAKAIKDRPVFLDFFECEFHMSADNNIEDLVGYVFVIDALNFCFWPSKWEYENLAVALKEAHKENPIIFTPEYLSTISAAEVKEKFFKGTEFPLLDERVRAVNEIGKKTMEHFEGKFMNILEKGEFDASKVLELVASTFLMFQDHAVYEGR